MKRILSFILSINLIFILVPGTVLAAPSWPSAVSIEADGGILMEAQTGTVLFAKNEDQPYYPASITKILTALIVLEHCSLDEEVTFSHDDVYNVEAGSSTAGIDEGDVLTVRDCLYALMLASANESANALACHVSGSREAFAELMNQTAESLGCTGSHFANPSGLNDENHYTTAHDMALITRAAIQNPDFLEIDGSTQLQASAYQAQFGRRLCSQPPPYAGKKHICILSRGFCRKDRLHFHCRQHPCYLCREKRYDPDRRCFKWASDSLFRYQGSF